MSRNHGADIMRRRLGQNYGTCSTLLTTACGTVPERMDRLHSARSCKQKHCTGPDSPFRRLFGFTKLGHPSWDRSGSCLEPQKGPP